MKHLALCMCVALTSVVTQGMCDKTSEPFEGRIGHQPSVSVTARIWMAGSLTADEWHRYTTVELQAAFKNIETKRDGSPNMRRLTGKECAWLAQQPDGVEKLNALPKWMTRSHRPQKTTYRSVNIWERAYHKLIKRVKHRPYKKQKIDAPRTLDLSDKNLREAKETDIH